jgi:hypothetical protein
MVAEIASGRPNRVVLRLSVRQALAGNQLKVNMKAYSESAGLRLRARAQACPLAFNGQ